jgi:curved DNA-binding protein
MDHYQTLGVPRTATEKEIKQAYRRLAGKYHPDKPGGDTARFQQIEQAYRILSDPTSREQYDRPSPQSHGFPGGFGNFGGNPFEDILNQFARQAHTPRQMIFSATVFVTLEQVASGATETIQVQTDSGPRAFQIRIPQSVEDGQRIRYDGLMPNGPLMIMFRLHRHAIFERRDMDLYMNHDISVFDLIL